jgi:Domain of unknown function (DUF4281)
MHPETLFGASGKLAMAGWALLVFAPRWRWSQRIASVIIPLTLAIVYFVLIVVYFAKSPGGFGTLGQVTQLFQNSWLLLAGWIHYLAFDLFLGAWQARQAQRLGISRFLVVPCLLLTFLFGPIGLLVFWSIRSVVTKQLFLDMDRGYRQASVH